MSADGGKLSIGVAQQLSELFNAQLAPMHELMVGFRAELTSVKALVEKNSVPGSAIQGSGSGGSTVSSIQSQQASRGAYFDESYESHRRKISIMDDERLKELGDRKAPTLMALKDIISEGIDLDAIRDTIAELQVKRVARLKGVTATPDSTKRHELKRFLKEVSYAIYDEKYYEFIFYITLMSNFNFIIKEPKRHSKLRCENHLIRGTNQKVYMWRILFLSFSRGQGTETSEWKGSLGGKSSL